MAGSKVGAAREAHGAAEGGGAEEAGMATVVVEEGALAMVVAEMDMARGEAVKAVGRAVVKAVAVATAMKR